MCTKLPPPQDWEGSTYDVLPLRAGGNILITQVVKLQAYHSAKADPIVGLQCARRDGEAQSSCLVLASPHDYLFTIAQ